MKIKKTNFVDLTNIHSVDLSKYCQRIGYQVFNAANNGQLSTITLSKMKAEVTQVFDELIRRTNGRNQ